MDTLTETRIPDLYPKRDEEHPDLFKREAFPTRVFHPENYWLPKKKGSFVSLSENLYDKHNVCKQIYIYIFLSRILFTA